MYSSILALFFLLRIVKTIYVPAECIIYKSTFSKKYLLLKPALCLKIIMNSLHVLESGLYQNWNRDFNEVSGIVSESL